MKFTNEILTYLSGNKLIEAMSVVRKNFIRKQGFDFNAN